MTRADRAGLREPVRQHHRAPHRAADRPARRRSTSTSRRCSRPRRGPAPRWRSTRYPDRLDLRDEHILWAKRHGVKFSVDTDSHATVHLAHMRYGVGTAQRGWLTKDDVINAWPLAKLRAFLRKGRDREPRGGGLRPPAAALVLRATVDRRRARAARPAAGPRPARRQRGWPPGSSRPRPTSRAIRRAIRSGGRRARTEVMFGRARPPVRVLHLRHALLHERGHRSPTGRGARCCSGPPSRSRASRRWRPTGGRIGPRLLCSGPARLTQALAIGRDDNGADLVKDPGLFLLAGSPVAARAGRPEHTGRRQRRHRTPLALLRTGERVRLAGPAVRPARRPNATEGYGFTKIVTVEPCSRCAPPSGDCDQTAPGR